MIYTQYLIFVSYLCLIDLFTVHVPKTPLTRPPESRASHSSASLSFDDDQSQYQKHIIMASQGLAMEIHQ